MPKRSKQFYRPGVPQVVSWPSAGLVLPEANPGNALTSKAANPLTTKTGDILTKKAA